MNKTDKNIKKVFSTYNENIGISVEEIVMGKLHFEKNYGEELMRSNKRIKTGIVLSILLFLVYFLTIYFDTLLQIDGNLEMKTIYMPSIFAALLVMVMFLLSTYSFRYSKQGIEI